MNEKGRAVSVGSGDLLGDRAQPIERAKTSDMHAPDARTKTSLPIRAFERASASAGMEPFTSKVSHAIGSDFSAIIGDRELRKRSGRT